VKLTVVSARGKEAVIAKQVPTLLALKKDELSFYRSWYAWMID
jgi:hypothetical protein